MGLPGIFLLVEGITATGLGSHPGVTFLMDMALERVCGKVGSRSSWPSEENPGVGPPAVVQRSFLKQPGPKSAGTSRWPASRVHPILSFPAVSTEHCTSWLPNRVLFQPFSPDWPKTLGLEAGDQKVTSEGGGPWEETEG